MIADDFFGTLAHQLGMRVETYPGFDCHGESPKRAYSYTDHEWPAQYYLTRNRLIVDWCERLVAAPDTHEEKPRSGTWYTIRYAKEQNVPITIVYPDGTFADD